MNNAQTCSPVSMQSNLERPITTRSDQWHPLPIGGGGYIRFVAPHPVTPHLLFAGCDVGGVFRSRDGGENWQPVVTGLMDAWDFCVACITFSPTGTLWIAVGGSEPANGPGRIYSSENEGDTWQRRNADDLPVLGPGGGPFPGRPLKQILLCDPRAPHPLTLTTVRDGVWRSEDGGVTWRMLALAGIPLASLAASPADPSLLYAVSPRRTGSDPGGVFVSVDHGLTWHHGAQGLDVRAVAPHPSDPHRAWISIFGDGVWQTQNGGGSWEWCGEGLPRGMHEAQSPVGSCLNGSSIQVDPFHPERIVLATRGRDGLFVSENSGRKWQPLITEPMDSNGWWAPIGEGEVAPKMFGTAHIVFDPHQPGRLYCCDMKSVYRSENGGTGWRACWRGLETTFVQRFWFHPDNSERLFLGLNDFTLFESPNGGRSVNHCHIGRTVPRYWERINIPTGLVFGGVGSPQRLYVSTCMWHENEKIGGVLRSDDGGGRWRFLDGDLPVARVHGMARSPLSEDRLLANVEGYGIFRSEDGGTRWHPSNTGIPNAGGFFGEKGWRHARGREFYPTHRGDVCFHPDQPDLVFVSGGEAGVFVSENGGFEWRHLSAGHAFDYVQTLRLQRLPAENWRLWTACGDSGLWCYDSAGQIWRQMDTAPSHDFDQHPDRDNLLVSCSPGVIRVSADEGVSWQMAGLPPQMRRVATVRWHPKRLRLYAGTLGNGAFVWDPEWQTPSAG